MRTIGIIGHCDVGAENIFGALAKHLLLHHPEDKIMLIQELSRHRPVIMPCCIPSIDINYEYEKKFKQWQYENMFFRIEDKFHSCISKLALNTFSKLHDANKLIEEKKSTLNRKDRETIQSIYLKITTK